MVMGPSLLGLMVEFSMSNNNDISFLVLDCGNNLILQNIIITMKNIFLINIKNLYTVHHKSYYYRLRQKISLVKFDKV